MLGNRQADRRNRNTREAYYRACCSFFAWLDLNGVGELADIEPTHVAAHIEWLGTSAAKPTVKQHLAAVRMLFDWLVVGQILAINPAHAVRGPNHVVKRGKTPVLVADDARTLLDSIPVTKKVRHPDGSEGEAADLLGLRDRALIAVMTYSLARVGAVVGMRVEDSRQALVAPSARKGRQAPRNARHTTLSKLTSTNTSARRTFAASTRCPSSGRPFGARAR